MNIVEGTVPKVTVHATRKEMWANFMKCMTDIGNGMLSEQFGNRIANAHKVLCGPMDLGALRKAFASGDTCIFLPEAIEKFDTECLREIVVDESYTIYHEDINF